MFCSTFMGIGIRNLSAAAEVESEITNIADALRQIAAGLLGTTVQLADLVRPIPNDCTERTLTGTSLQVIPFVAGGFMYIGAVAVLPTYVRCGRVQVQIQVLIEGALLG